MGVMMDEPSQVIDRFQGSISPRWVRFAVGGGQIEQGPDSLLLSLEAARSDELSDAEINDHRLLPRERFPWNPPLTMEVRARFSHPAGELLGTAGFGFWNAPTGWEGRVGAPPNWVWFFYASSPSQVALSADQPGWGWKAAMLNGGNAAGPLMPLVDMASRTPLANRALLWLARRSLSMGDRGLEVEMREWHTYRLDWRPELALFQVDGREVFRVANPPTLPLGFVAWVDNQWATMTPGGGLENGLLGVAQRQWLEIDYIEIRRQPLIQ